MKEATASDYIKVVLPLLLRNGVVHFLGYGNRLGFDPFPSDIQVIVFPCLPNLPYSDLFTGSFSSALRKTAFYFYQQISN